MSEGFGVAAEFSFCRFSSKVGQLCQFVGDADVNAAWEYRPITGCGCGSCSGATFTQPRQSLKSTVMYLVI